MSDFDLLNQWMAFLDGKTSQLTADKIHFAFANKGKLPSPEALMQILLESEMPESLCFEIVNDYSRHFKLN